MLFLSLYIVAVNCRNIFNTGVFLKPFACYECGVQFSKWATIRLHNKLHHSEVKHDMFTCEFDGCDKSYNLKASLKVHQDRVHFGKPLPVHTRSVCETCGKSFRTQFFLKVS